MSDFSITEMASRLRSRETSSTELTERALAAVARVDHRLNAMVCLDTERARRAAAEADAALAAGDDRGPLLGIPVAVKDIIDMAGLPTRCGSPAYPSTPRSADAAVVSKLRHAGAVIIGKTTSHELACGVYSPPCANPWDLERLPGGSSGGSGAAVAAGIVVMALGSDTGGSIRIPASVCGIVGLKPTYGLVSRSGVEPLSPSLDHIGPLAATVVDCAYTLNAIAGADPPNGTPDVSPTDYAATLDRGVAGVRVGVVSGGPFSPLAREVAEAFSKAIDDLRSLGVEPVQVEIPALHHTLAAEFAIVAPEAAFYHRRLLRERPEQVDASIRSMLINGTLGSAADYRRGLAARHVIREAIRSVFEAQRLVAVVTPTLPFTAARRDQERFEVDGTTEAVTDAYVRTTAPFNLSGLPALSVPCGFDTQGLPIGLQIAGRPFDEASVLRVGAAYQAATTWSARRPPIYEEAS